MKISKTWSFLASILLSQITHAESDITIHMVNANLKMKELQTTLASVKKEAGVSIEFPTFVPKSSKSYFVSADTASKQYGFNYMINVDSTADCHGVKYCNIGIVTARANAAVDMMKDKANKNITTKVMLADGLDAYYTPGHAMGDYFPASIQWVDNNVLYMISWNIDSASAAHAKEMLVFMANSAKHPGAG